MRLIIQDGLIILLVIVCTITVLLDLTDNPDTSLAVFRIATENSLANAENYDLDSGASYNVRAGSLMDVDEEVDEMIINDEIVYEPVDKKITKLLQCEGPGGFGNRIRSISSCFLLAEILDRQLVVVDNWPAGCPISNHFEPAYLHLQKERVCNEQNAHVVKIPYNFHTVINSKSIMKLRNRNDSCIIIKSSSSFMYQNFDEKIVKLLKKKNLTLKDLRSTFKNVFKKLFKPKLALDNILDKNINQMLNDNYDIQDKKLVCFEVKSGWNDEGFGKWTELCLQKLIKVIKENLRNSSDSTIFLSTDNNMMGSLIKLTFGDNIFIAEEKLMEFTTKKLSDLPCTMYNKIYTDFLILTKCHKSYISHFSSFGILSSKISELSTINIMKCEESEFSIIEKSF